MVASWLADPVRCVRETQRNRETQKATTIVPSRYEISGVYLGLTSSKCCWRNDDGTETFIAKLDLGGGVRDGETQIIKGTAYHNDLQRGRTYRMFGTEKKYRDTVQFVFDSFVEESPSGEEAIVTYLMQCDGIGPATARAMYAKYGVESIETLREHPGRVAAEIPRVSPEAAKAASAVLCKSKHVEKSKVDLLHLLKGRGFPKKLVDRLIREMGSAAATRVRRNPYLLLKYPGCGFAKVDDLYCRLGLNVSRAKRQALCAWHAIHRQKNGDTWYPFSVVKSFLNEKIGGTTVDPERAMRLAIRGGLLSEAYDCGQRLVAERAMADQEMRIAKLMVEAHNEPTETGRQPLWTGIEEVIDGVSDHQREAIQIATSAYVSMLTGLPGTGKTYTVARMIRAIAQRFGAFTIAVCALAGKAAVKMSSELEKVGVPIQATTIHSLLGIGNAGGFKHGRMNPLPCKFIIVDESSMPGDALFLALLEARQENAHILFIGDENQLPPIDSGAPFRDFIAAKIPRGHLTEIQRQSAGSRIVRACNEIISTGRFTPSPKFNPAIGEDFAFLERETPEEQVDTLAALVEHHKKKWDEGADSAIDPVWDIQIIVPINGKSELGRRPLNVKLQQLFNPDGKRVDGNPFRIGDKIVCRKSGDYRTVGSSSVVPKPASTDPFDQSFGTEPEPIRIRNGEMAEVLDVSPVSVVARLLCPERIITIKRVPTSVKDEPEDEDVDSDGDGEDAGKRNTGTGCDFELGYACSGHAFQGCEVHTAIVMIDSHSSARMVCSKQWIFTGYSRGKSRLMAIGQYKIALEMCRRDHLSKRRTLLAERIVSLRSRVAFTQEVRSLVLDGV